MLIRSTGSRTDAMGQGGQIKVAIAGATGYAGQELLRLLARHPGAAVTAAIGLERHELRAASSRRSRICGRPRRAARCSTCCARKPMRCSWRCPKHAAAALAPSCWLAAAASSISRVRSGCGTTARGRSGIPHDHQLPEGTVYGLTEHARQSGLRSARLSLVPGLLSDGGRAGTQAAGRTAGLLGRPTSSSTRSRACRAPARRRPSARISASATAACRPTACSSTGMPPRSSRSSGAPVTFVPHLVPIDRGILETIYATRRSRASTEAAIADALRAAYADAPFVRLTGAALPEIKHVAHTNFCDIGWQRRRRHAAARARRRASTTWSRARPARPCRTSTSRSASTSARPAVMPCDRPTILKLGGELLEDAAATVARAAARRRRAGSPRGAARRRPRRRPGDRRGHCKARGIAKQQVDGLRITDAATLDASSRPGRRSQHARSSRRSTRPACAVGLTGADAALRAGASGAAASDDAGGTGGSRTASASRSAGAGRGCCSDLDGARLRAGGGQHRRRAEGGLLNVNADTLAAHLRGRLRARAAGHRRWHRRRARRRRARRFPGSIAEAAQRADRGRARPMPAWWPSCAPASTRWRTARQKSC